MHIILHLAVSSDGFIAKPDGDSDWVSPVDGELFVQRAKQTGCIVVGKRTFDQYRGTLYPIDDVLNILLTHETDVLYEESNVAVANSPAEAASVAQSKGYSTMLIAGGAKTASAFLDAKLIDEIYLSVHPIELGTGIKPFDDLSADPNYKLVGQRQLAEDIKELHYSMI